MTVRIHPYSNCRGAVLAVALLFLVILTLLGITVMSVGQQELKMGGQFQQQSLVHERAEACLNSAETDATTLVDAQLNTATAALSESAGLINVAGGTTAATVSDPAFWNDPAHTLPCGTDSRYVIEYLGVRDVVTASDRYTGKTSPMHAFRITARGYDVNSDTQVLLQTIYLRNKV